MRLAAILATTALAAGSASAQQAPRDFQYGDRNTDFAPIYEEQTRAPLVETFRGGALDQRVIAGGLEHPWAVVALPDDGGYLVSERAGRLRHVTDEGEVSDPIEGVPEVFAQEQGGLLDIRLGPDFEDDRMVYMTYAKPMDDDMSTTAAARGVLSEDLASLSDVEDIFVGEPPSPTPMHYGSRLAFDGEGHVFITTGEHFTEEERELAQDLSTSYGKILRLNLDGSIPEDNPFVGDGDALDAIWSYGHRNVQAIVFDEDGTLWEIEMGPQGGDELNRVEPGLNYGWPVISYGEQYGGGEVGSGVAAAEGLEQPVYFWDPVISPGGAGVHAGEAFSEWNGSVLIGSLYPGGIVRIELDEEGLVRAEERVLRDAGRVRTVEVLEDGTFLFLSDTESGAIVHVTPDEEGM